MSENSQKEIQQKVLDRIRSGRIQMHSRAYFWGWVIFTAAVAVLTLAVSTFVLSFIVFSIHESGEQFLLGFGERGLTAFLGLFPWISLIVAIALLFLLEALLQGFKMGYRFSMLSLFVLVFVSSSLLAAIVDITPLHGTLLDFADRHELPVVGDLYENIRGSHESQGVFRGTITSVGSGEIVITHDDGDHDADDGTWSVMLPPNGVPPLSVGDRVYVFGTSTDNIVQAYGVQKLSPDQ